MYRARSAPALSCTRASGTKAPRSSYLLDRGEPSEEPTKHRKPDDTPVPAQLHSTKCGIAGKLYSPFDYITPICDSMSALHDKTYGNGMVRLVQREERRHVRERMASGSAPGSSAFDNCRRDTCEDEMSINQYASNAFVEARSLRPGELCRNCHTTEPGSQQVDSKTGYLVCEKCGAVGGRHTYGTDYKEINDADGKSTARADFPSANQHKSPAFVNMPSQGTSIPTGAKRKNKICFAQELVDRHADREETKLSRGHQRKLTAIIQSIDGLLTEMSPVDSDIARRIRMDASAVFCASVCHRETCKKKECQKALFDKPTRVIARESFGYSIDKMSAGAGIDGVSKQKVVALQERVQSSLVFSHRENATQHQSCRAMIAAISVGDNTVECPAVDEESLLKTSEHKSAPNPMAGGNGMPMARQNSDVQSSSIVQMRDQISRLSILYGFPSQVQGAALSALQDGAFSKAITDQPIAPSKKLREASTYLLLHSIAEQTGGASACPSEEHCRRVGLDGIDVRPIIDRVRSILPKAVAGATVADDDELY